MKNKQQQFQEKEYFLVSTWVPSVAVPGVARYRATYRVPAGLLLLECGGQGDRRNHGHRRPLLRLLADVDGLRGERFKRRFEAGEQRLLITRVVVLHCGAATTQQRARGVSAGRDRKGDLITSTRCARPRQPIGGGQSARGGADWPIGRAGLVT